MNGWKKLNLSCGLDKHTFQKCGAEKKIVIINYPITSIFCHKNDKKIITIQLLLHTGFPHNFKKWEKTWNVIKILKFQEKIGNVYIDRRSGLYV